MTVPSSLVKLNEKSTPVPPPLSLPPSSSSSFPSWRPLDTATNVQKVCFVFFGKLFSEFYFSLLAFYISLKDIKVIFHQRVMYLTML